MLLEVLKFDDEGGHGSIVFVAGDDDGRVSHVVHERGVAEERRVRGERCDRSGRGRSERAGMGWKE